MKPIGKLVENRIIVWNREKAKDIYEADFFGKLKEDRLELSLVEACFLADKKRITIENKGKKMSFKKLHEYACKIDPRFYFRYIVYRDLRTRELPARTGFKFGCDFRVYNKGVKPLKRGPKQAGEHTKWIVFAVPAGFSFSFPELSRAVRLAHNIRANMLWAVVDKKEKVNYFKVVFFKP
jgi:tRNA-intron endonuclease, archaea type